MDVAVRSGGNAENRQITLSMPVPADEDEEPLARRDVRLNSMTAVVDPENFDRWIFPDEPSERGSCRHWRDPPSKIDAAAMEHIS